LTDKLMHIEVGKKKNSEVGNLKEEEAHGPGWGSRRDEGRSFLGG